MATPIPGFAAKVESSAETVLVTTGAVQTLAATRWYYLVSNRTAASNGQSLLKAIKDMLDTSLAGTAWTVRLAKVGGIYRVQVSHDNGASRTVTFSSSFASALGFSASSFTVNASTTVTAAWPSVYWWTPDMPISMTGPEQFDPAVSYGVPESAGNSQRAPDMTTAYVQNGVQWSAEFTFNGVQFAYKIRAQVGHTNEDLETFWRRSIAPGGRMLMWRDRDNATGSNAPSEGSTAPWNYIEYAPQEATRSKLPAKPTTQYNLAYWDVKIELWVTENGETPLSD